MIKIQDGLKVFDIILTNPFNNTSESIISQETLITNLWKFLCSDLEKKVIYNPGSAFSCTNPNKIKDIYYFGEDIYLAVLMTFSALEIIYKSAGMTESYVNQIPSGTPIICSDDPKERYIFKEICIKGGFVGAYLSTGNGGRFVPKSLWNVITINNGERTSSTRGRSGLRDYKKLKNFLVDCLQFIENEIPAETTLSTIITINDKAKERARLIIKNVKLRYIDKQGNTNDIALSDLVNTAFYNEPKNPLFFSGNIGKQEPALKIVSNLNTAIELCLRKYRKKDIAKIIITDSIIEKSKIPGILNLLSNSQKVILETDYSYISRLNEVLELSTFKDKKIKSYIPDGALLTTNNITTKQLSPITEILRWQLEDIINKKTEAIFFKTSFNDSDYSELRSLLFEIKRADVLSENKDLYFMKSYFILKLLSASILKIENIQDELDIYNIFNELKSIQLPNYNKMAESKNRCEDLLTKLIESRKNDKEREEFLINLLLEENRKAKDQNIKRYILILVHKKYLQLSLERFLLKYKFNNLEISIDTCGKIKNKKYYDLIICSGLIINDSFNIFNINFSEKVILLCAKYKETEFITLRKKALKNKKRWLKTSFFELRIKEEIEEDNNDLIEKQQDFTDSDFENIIKGIISNNHYFNNISNNRHEVQVNTLAIFDDESCGFFTPNYKVNVLKQNDESKEYEVISLPIEKVIEGDDIIFVERHGKMRDAIKEIQNYLIEKEALPENEINAVKITQQWREDLFNYVKNKERHETKKSIAERCNISIIEFNNWLNFDFYIVGPDSKSIPFVGQVINNDLMVNNPKSFKNQVDIVNHLHTKIRRALGEAIIAKEEGKIPTGEYAKKIFDEIGNLENIRCVQEIKAISKKVDVTITNQPISY